MHRLGAPAVELLKFQSFGWISILALRLYQVSRDTPQDLSLTHLPYWPTYLPRSLRMRTP